MSASNRGPDFHDAQPREFVYKLSTMMMMMMMMMMNSFARCSSLYIYAAMRECCQACRQLQDGRQPTRRSSRNSSSELLVNRPRIERCSF
ncbi:hypothetical protein ACN42_g10805 [Penicillium freii]|uniref:Uncharacterized protein n=1 Tax=Penicillium freii TaxID=48697 RepID=A0A101M9I1_PENFR|nr:hypothetical protein ACN42_g10805 [Penicillium freii]